MKTVQRESLIAFLPYGEPPLFEFVHGIIHVPSEVKYEVFADYAHKVVSHVFHIVLDLVAAHVGVDCGQALGDAGGAAGSLLTI